MEHDPSAPPSRGWSRLPSTFDRDAHPAEFGRVLALSDGVFAIAVTLLVLDLALAAGESNRTLAAQLADRQSHFLAFAVSVLLVGTAWWSHHRLFAMLQGVSGPLVLLNVLYLALVVLIPFLQSILAAYPLEPLAYVLFAGVFVALGVVDVSLFLCARGQGLLRVQLRGRAMRLELLQSGVFIGSFLISMPLAYLLGPFTALLWIGQSAAQAVLMRLQGGDDAGDAGVV